MKDRIVEFPNRYKLVPVPGTTDQYDFVPMPGTVTEEGTAYSKGNLLSDDVAALYDLIADEATVNLAFKMAPRFNLASYIAFCANVNTNSLDAAFGKNNEGLVKNLGLQLAMYAWFKGDSKITNPFTNLMICHTFLECVVNYYSFKEIENNANLLALINSCPYAKSIYDGNKIKAKYQELAVLAGLENPLNYNNADAYINTLAAYNAIFDNSSSLAKIVENKIMIKELSNSDSLMDILMAKPNVITALNNSSLAVYVSSAKGSYLTYSTLADKATITTARSWVVGGSGYCPEYGAPPAEASHMYIKGKYNEESTIYTGVTVPSAFFDSITVSQNTRNDAVVLSQSFKCIILN